MPYNTIDEALEALRAGELVLVTDDPDRENEGDLICAAEFADTERVNFMATHAKGLICMPMSEAICRRLALPQMVPENTDNHQTAFTVSIDHISTTTGISAGERSVTARCCADPAPGRRSFAARGTCFRCSPAGTAFWNAPATLRPPSICCGWPALRNAASAVKSCGRTAE